MGPPKPPVPHVAPIYRLTATALGAGMWFWVREPLNPCVTPVEKLLLMETPLQLMYRAKKDGTMPIVHANATILAPKPGHCRKNANIFSHRTGFDGLEAPLGSLKDAEELVPGYADVSRAYTVVIKANEREKKNPPHDTGCGNSRPCQRYAHFPADFPNKQ